MEPEVIKQKIEASFPPYHCVVKLLDFDARMKFRIFDQDKNSIYTSDEIIITDHVFNDSTLNSHIKKAKNEIKKKGYPLD